MSYYIILLIVINCEGQHVHSVRTNYDNRIIFILHCVKNNYCILLPFVSAIPTSTPSNMPAVETH